MPDSNDNRNASSEKKGFHPVVPANFLPAKKDTYILDVLWGQPIMLIQVASTSELRENQWNDLLFFEIFPLIASGPQKYKHKIGHKYFSFQHPKKLGAFFNH